MAEQNKESSGALLHLAWALRDNVRYLIFAWIEVFPPGFPVQPGHDFKSPKNASKHATRVYVGRFPMSVIEAEFWYGEVARGRMQKPVFPGAKVTPEPVMIETGPLESEPPDQAECLAMALPFLPALHTSVHMKGLFGLPDLETQRAVLEPQTLAWLSKNLYFSLGEFPEYLGAVLHVRYDPRIRSVEQRLSPRTDGNDDEVFRINTWPGADLTGCEMLMIDRRPFGIAPIQRKPITSSTFVVSWPRQLSHTGFAIIHETDGLCWWHEPLTYIRTIKIGINPVGRRKQIQLRSKDGELKDSYEISESMTDLATMSVIGDPDGPPTVASRYYSADNRRKRRKLRDSLNLRWFDDPKVAAVEVRSLIKNATKEVWIVDPYSVGEDLVRFALAANQDVPVEVLTSAKALKAKLEDRKFTAADRVRDILSKITTDKIHKKLQVLVMSGREPPIHDRFLVIDGRAWLSGNSLNSIGERPSVLVEIPEPSDVIEKLEAYRADAAPFDQWLAKHKSAKVKGK